MGRSKYKDYMSDFKSYLYAIKNLSDLYINNIIGTVSQFLNFINAYKFDNRFNSVEEIDLNDIRSISNNDIYSYIFYLVEKDYKQGSRNVKIEHLRAFFEFLFKIKNTIFKQPFRAINKEKRENRHLPNYLSLDESKRLSECNIEKTDNVNIKIRNNAIINLVLSCGLRVSEVANLNLSDFKFETRQFLIHGKGKKERIGYLNDNSLHAIEEYLKIRSKLHIKDKKDDDALFLTKKGTRIDVRSIRRDIKEAYSNAGIDEKAYSVHTLRHTCATLLYKYGNINIHTIQELLRSF